jgi:chemotaxis protein CheY-P-specific phosphatase CheC
MSAVTDFSDEDRERLYELTSIGASHASMAFTRLLDRAIAPSAPQFREANAYLADDSWSTGVIFQADGELSGLVAILLPAATCDMVAERLTRGEQTDDPDEAIESALRELGNIVASRTMSAIADRLGGRIMLSVPVLVMKDVGTAFASMIRKYGAKRCVECDLTDVTRDICVRLVIVLGSKPT